ncbi:hypothetical protein [Sphingobium chlorophenolicum]|uniref:Uncharacterized protein n=1 Tax=Sphingobium chlorophenolicum TaxID=46429 RepID=A0A081RGM9_SPHCR|nr:hypothetical protein [Sphingobium chlorophenolicum]KEQ54352.1 hypothetical protein BV95_01417 [Sphingobium chlorophenolicum]
MTSSSPILLAYLALLTVALLTPYASLWLRPGRPPVWIICLAIMVGGVVLTAARHGDVAAVGTLLLLPLIDLGIISLLGGISVILLFTSVMWWSPSFEITPAQYATFAGLALIPGLLLRWNHLAKIPERQPLLWLAMLVCLLIGLVAGLLTAPFESLEPFYTAWHHWGALLAPVEAWRGGGLPYRDFPIQYGLGPTVLLMASCGENCWRGLYNASIIANALYFATLAGSAILLTSRSPRGIRWLALLAMFSASFVWTGFPIQLAGPALTPAVAGLRFLTISAMLFHILLAEQRQVRRDWIGHLLWLIDLFWSPEAAFFGTAIWWPYLAIRDAAATEGRVAVLLAQVHGALRGGIALVLGSCGLVALLWWLSEGSISVDDFFAYIQHPPGIKPINPVGTIWIALASVGLGLGLLPRQGLSSRTRSLYVCLLGFLAAIVYFISRSHDNNILNLFPLMLLLLLAILDNVEQSDVEQVGIKVRSFIRSFVHVTMAAMVTFVAIFNFGAWAEGMSIAGPLTLGPRRMIARFDPHHGDKPAPLPADAVAGLEYLRARDAGMVILLDRRKVMPSSVGRSWTGVNNVANFEPLPGAKIIHYIQRSALTYRRPGWILVGPGYEGWAEGFQMAYDLREQRIFGTYRAYYLVPRRAFAGAGEVWAAASRLDRDKPPPS